MGAAVVKNAEGQALRWRKLLNSSKQEGVQRGDATAAQGSRQQAAGCRRLYLRQTRLDCDVSGLESRVLGPLRPLPQPAAGMVPTQRGQHGRPVRAAAPALRPLTSGGAAPASRAAIIHPGCPSNTCARPEQVHDVAAKCGRGGALACSSCSSCSRRPWHAPAGGCAPPTSHLFVGDGQSKTSAEAKPASRRRRHMSSWGEHGQGVEAGGGDGQARRPRRHVRHTSQARAGPRVAGPPSKLDCPRRCVHAIAHLDPVRLPDGRQAGPSTQVTAHRVPPFLWIAHMLTALTPMVPSASPPGALMPEGRQSCTEKA